MAAMSSYSQTLLFTPRWESHLNHLTLWVPAGSSGMPKTRRLGDDVAGR